MPNMIEVNHQANIADLGTIVSEALFHLEDDNTDSVRDLLLDAHSSIYPNAAHTATPEENARICAGEPTASSKDTNKPDVLVNKAVLGAVIEELADAAGLVRVVSRQLRVTYEDLNRDEYPDGDRPVMTVYQISTLASLIDSKLLELQGNIEFLVGKEAA